MTKAMLGMKVAALVANGFEEKQFIKAQRSFIEMGATLKIISTNQGLVNGWEGQAWGHNFAVDASLNTALGVDYAGLLIPGGQRSIEKLKSTAHTKRFIGSFMAAHKPVAVMGDALSLMIMSEQIDGRTVAGPVAMRDEAIKMGAKWSEEPMMIDNAMLTGIADLDNMDMFIEMMQDVFTNNMMMDQEAA
ncbi:MAG: DJ-1/PfpI family protein [Alphaproteobacteria bacterium]|nr:DJ-1/PfpI family protein [Alphaproteobacteria bacterium]NCQ88195.1 DJ-1/PfpI family protein [Alphaproteobacteria bacterium]NCT05298.1 DJ-1/PfpI family protein [Alphaproteobacteria bacterium]